MAKKLAFMNNSIIIGCNKIKAEYLIDLHLLKPIAIFYVKHLFKRN